MSFPSSWCAGYDSTLFTLPGLEKVMNPKPRDLLVAGSFITITSATSPNCEKYSLTLSGVVCQLNPPINIFPGSLGISSPPIMVPSPRGVRGENIPVGSNTELWGGDDTGEMDPPKLFIFNTNCCKFCWDDT